MTFNLPTPSKFPVWLHSPCIGQGEVRRRLRSASESEDTMSHRRWNFTPSPGWTRDQVAILRLALMKYGVGRWVQILDTGLLPGKLIQQLNGQTQRLIGQQSLAGKRRNPKQGCQKKVCKCVSLYMCETRSSKRPTSVHFGSPKGRSFRARQNFASAAYTGLHVDIDQIRADNESRKDAQRKSGLIIWSGRELLLLIFSIPLSCR